MATAEETANRLATNWENKRQVKEQNEDHTLAGDILKYAPGAFGKIIAPFGVGGAAAIHGAETAANYLRLPGLPKIEGSENRLQENVKFLEDQWGLNKGGGAIGVIPNSAKPAPGRVTDPVFGKDAEPVPVPVNENSGAFKKYGGNIYEALKHVKNTPEGDAAFKDFVDKHPGLPGIGYNDVGRGKIQRVIENPVDKPVDLSGMTMADADMLIKAIHAKGVMDQGTASAQERKDVATEKAEAKKIDQFSNSIKLNSPMVDLPDGGKGYATDIGHFKHLIQGGKFPDPETEKATKMSYQQTVDEVKSLPANKNIDWNKSANQKSLYDIHLKKLLRQNKIGAE
jgi:hypothetical protein